MDTIGCTICLDPFAEADGPICLIRNCGHTFHQKCIEEWMMRSGTCPSCRIPCSSSADLQRLILATVPANINPNISSITGQILGGTGSEELQLKYAMSQSALEEATVKLGEISIEKETLLEDVTRLKDQLDLLRSIQNSIEPVWEELYVLDEDENDSEDDD